MNITAFTICSTNYFAHARVLAKSWLQHHSDTSFYVFLVDELHAGVNYRFDERVVVIPIADVNIPTFDTLVQQYNIVELNTAVKPDVFFYLFERKGCQKVVYLDPDIKVYDRFDELSSALDQYSIIVTPHFTTPIDDGESTTDFRMLGSGLFNLGFIALSRIDAVRPFLTWWRDRLYKYCYYDLTRGMFYDQVWCNYVTVFFENYFILKDPGYNMANWNFHERRLSKTGSGNFRVNEKYPLYFFHFSGFRFEEPLKFSRYHSRYTFASRPDLREIYEDYHTDLGDNEAASLAKIPCVYYERHKQYKTKEQEQAYRQLTWRAKATLWLTARARTLYARIK
ncbi:glycosyl transferase [Chryseolinea soli]|uniref:Glycosyl transferase n=1 Tax=Chryseolinea soli TaxID=2321403 RepID=A0A385SK88_9BACT|nr:glycosyl transferase [Chryseolinea soli]AYB31322.1 glycosyl transferase [Chryseolinea soli]